uniref:Putative secreted protein n=1 Tax=Amblyomma cajennense TaxID=34607 RepID=A0A023FDZ7_AMBCJ
MQQLFIRHRKHQTRLRMKSASLLISCFFVARFLVRGCLHADQYQQCLMADDVLLAVHWRKLNVGRTVQRRTGSCRHTGPCRSVARALAAGRLRRPGSRVPRRDRTARSPWRSRGPQR